MVLLCGVLVWLGLVFHLGILTLPPCFRDLQEIGEFGSLNFLPPPVLPLNVLIP